MTAALEATGVPGMEFDEYETEALDGACADANRAEQLQQVYDAELAGEARPTVLSRLAAELRHCERQSVQMLERVRLSEEPPKSARHQRAAPCALGSVGGRPCGSAPAAGGELRCRARIR